MITGFPSPAQGYEDNTIDLNSLVVRHPAATVFMQIDTSRYVSMGIYRGDLLVVDRSLYFNRDSIVVYEGEGEFHLARASSLRSDSVICGVVTYVLHKIRGVL